MTKPTIRTYSFVFMDAVYYKVKEDKQAIKAAYVVRGINMDGEKEMLGIWAGTNESSKFCLSVLNDLKNKANKAKLIFPTDDSLLKMLYFAPQNVAKRWTRVYPNWGQLNIQFAEIINKCA